MSDKEIEMGTSSRLAKKFSGCLLGSLLGDCLGERFEYQGKVTVQMVDEFFSQIKEGKITDGLRYTDDSAMMKVSAKSIIDKRSVDAKDLAKKFSEEYYSDPDRGYGKNVPTVFSQLRKQAAGEDVFQPARDQFNGGGSYGNGAAMRVAPVALFHHKDIPLMIEAARNSSLVTHAHRNGYNGAILMCLAIQSVLSKDSGTTVDSKVFSEELLEKMAKVEQNESQDYCEKLKIMQQLLTKSTPPTQKDVISQLGHNVSALKSVPTAIFSFLYAQNPISEISVDNQFERTVRYAISLGGDTDTIACMAGGLAGAHLGVDGIPPHLIEVCEDNKLVAELAEKLFIMATQ